VCTGTEELERTGCREACWALTRSWTMDVMVMLMAVAVIVLVVVTMHPLGALASFVTVKSWIVPWITSCLLSWLAGSFISTAV